MSQLKDKILELRKLDKSYKEIKNELNCSLSTISHYCGEGQFEKTKRRNEILRKRNRLLNKVSNFKQTKRERNLVENIRKFQLRNKKSINFTYNDVLDKFGQHTKCYLSGQDIDLVNDNDYHLDHIIPIAKGGTNSLDNLGILKKDINIMKKDILVDDFLTLCKIILENNNYLVKKI